MDYLVAALFICSGLCALGGYWLSEIDHEQKADEGRRLNQRAADKLEDRDAGMRGD